MPVERTVVFSHTRNLDRYIAECPADPLTALVRHHIPQGSRVLEAGSGSGKWLAYLHQNGYTISGIEINSESVDRFKQAFPHIACVVGDVNSLPYGDGEFDAVLSLGVLEHLVDGPAQAISEMRRVLQPDGIAIVSVPCANWLWRLEKLKDRVLFAVFGSRALRKIMRREPLGFDMNQQRLYFQELVSRLTPGLSVKMQFTPSNGVRFYEYRFTQGQFMEMLERNGFRVISVHPMYQDQRLYQVFGRIVGSWGDNGLSLNRVGRLLNRFLPQSQIAHMLVAVISMPAFAEAQRC